MTAIKAQEFPNKTFASKGELFADLKKYKETLIGLKKNRNSDSIKSVQIKGLEETKGLELEDGFVYAVINTTKVLDSHNDVHLDGIWNKSVNEQQGKIYFVADHDLSVKSVIAFPQDVEISVKEIPFKNLGTKFEGNTQALIFKVAKENIKLEQARQIIEEKQPIEHSVRMEYVKMDLAINSEDAEFKEEKAIWDNTFSMVANKERAIENGYYWAVSEAKIIKEGSMVLAGSNDVTPMLHPEKEIQPSKSTDQQPQDTENEASKDGAGKLNTIFI